MSSVRETTTIRTDVHQMLIRDLVERYPEVMPILHQYGMDLCCGGGHTVPEAASLHGIEADSLISEILTTIQSGRS